MYKNTLYLKNGNKFKFKTEKNMTLYVQSLIGNQNGWNDTVLTIENIHIIPLCNIDYIKSKKKWSLFK